MNPAPPVTRIRFTFSRRFGGIRSATGSSVWGMIGEEAVTARVRLLNVLGAAIASKIAPPKDANASVQNKVGIAMVLGRRWATRLVGRFMLGLRVSESGCSDNCVRTCDSTVEYV